MSALSRHQHALGQLKARGRYRQLLPRGGVDFSSNDYLGLAASGLMRDIAKAALERGVPVGAGGSRLLRGNTSEHELLEDEASRFFGTEATLFMGGGFNANMAIFSTLPQQGDLVLYDALIHASTHDGMRLGRAECRSFTHSDPTSCEEEIAAWRKDGGTGQIWIAVEALYSMDGDIAPLSALASLAENTDAILVIDEAHSTGLFGEQGRGLGAALAGLPNVLSLHTCGKALGASGALICGQRILIETLINKARSFIYATAPSTLNAALVRGALEAVQQRPELRKSAWDNIHQAWREADRFCGLSGFESQILPVVIGEDKRTMQIAFDLQKAGYDIRGIRPPTVPRGTSRLRISITPNADGNAITKVFQDLAPHLQEVAA